MTIPNSVTIIRGGAFSGCDAITSIGVVGSGASIEIPNSVTTIELYTFAMCSGLTSVTIPNGVTTIDANAFQACSSLTSVTLPNSVTSIGHYAFYCENLETITCYATTAPTIQNGTFRSVKTNGTLYVLTGSTGYDVWMGTGNYYLGKYSWTKVEQ